MPKVFVYGTLKDGYGNNYLLQDAKAEKLGTDAIKGTMYNLGAFPGVRLGGDHDVFGEVWECPDSAIPRLDRLEGHPTFYKREEVDTKFGKAFVYEINQAHAGRHVVRGGVW